jgi:hypothetical protein
VSSAHYGKQNHLEEGFRLGGGMGYQALAPNVVMFMDKKKKNTKKRQTPMCSLGSDSVMNPDYQLLLRVYLSVYCYSVNLVFHTYIHSQQSQAALLYYQGYLGEFVLLTWANLPPTLSGIATPRATTSPIPSVGHE